MMRNLQSTSLTLTFSLLQNSSPSQNIVQYADAIGGRLLVHVYAGADGSFDMVEDDGSTLNYLQDYTGSTRTTSWAWDDSSRTLTWTTSGGYSGGPQSYKTVTAVLFAEGRMPATSKTVTIGNGGTINF